MTYIPPPPHVSVGDRVEQHLGGWGMERHSANGILESIERGIGTVRRADGTTRKRPVKYLRRVQATNREGQR